MDMRCCSCDKIKNTDEFTKNKSRHNGLNAQCKACDKLLRGFIAWWHSEGSKGPEIKVVAGGIIKDDLEEHTKKMCKSAWLKGASV